MEVAKATKVLSELKLTELMVSFAKVPVLFIIIEVLYMV